MFRHSRTIFGAIALSVTTFALAAVADMHGGGGDVTISAVAKPALGEFSGELHGVSVKEADGKLTFKADLPGGLKMGMRDSHAREAFEVEKHRNVQLVVDKSDLKIPDDNKSVSGKVKGRLTLHGETKPVTVSYKASRKGSEIDLTGSTFTFNYVDFGVPKICKLAICVEPPVTVTIAKMKLQAK